MTDTDASPSHRIVIGIDGSACSIAALNWAARQAELTGAVLELVTTWRWPNTYGVQVVVPSDYDPGASVSPMPSASGVPQDRGFRPTRYVRPWHPAPRS